MAKSIYVGNLPFETTGEELTQLFRQFGTVKSGEVIIDRFSGRSRGFGLVEMPSDEEADQAIKALNGHVQGGRPLVVNEARPRGEAPRLERGGPGGRIGGQPGNGPARRRGGLRDADPHNGDAE